MQNIVQSWFPLVHLLLHGLHFHHRRSILILHLSSLQNVIVLIADLGTRHIGKLELVNQESIWINGFDWIKRDESCFPTKSMKDIKLSNEEVTTLQKENVLKYQESLDVQDCYLVNTMKTIIPVEVQECYNFSNYLLDPNRRSFHITVRILGFVLMVFPHTH